MIAIAVGVLIGAGFLLVGSSVFLSGIGRPGVGPFVTAIGVVGGNLQLVVGLLLIIAGLAILSGIVSYSIDKLTSAGDTKSED